MSAMGRKRTLGPAVRRLRRNVLTKSFQCRISPALLAVPRVGALALRLVRDRLPSSGSGHPSKSSIDTSPARQSQSIPTTLATANMSEHSRTCCPPKVDSCNEPYRQALAAFAASAAISSAIAGSRGPSNTSSLRLWPLPGWSFMLHCFLGTPARPPQAAAPRSSANPCRHNGGSAATSSARAAGQS